MKTCSIKEKTCVEDIELDTSKCKLPCEGIFASVRKFPTLNVKQDESHLIFVEGYKKFKRFFEKSQGS